MKSRKILFLDFDGVLDTYTYDQKLQSEGKATKDGYGYVFDPACVDCLRLIVEATGAEIVVTSTWKEYMSPDDIKDMWAARCLPGKVTDTTAYVMGGDRGDEIAAWLKEHDGEVLDYAIIDDLDAAAFAEDQRPHLFAVDRLAGLDKDTVARVIDRLGGKTQPWCFCKTIRGARHIDEGLPCQDYSLTVQRDGITMAVVCDGHGAPMCFRSDVGARLAAETAAECAIEFAKGARTLLCPAPPTVGKSDKASNDGTDLWREFKSLFATILYNWEEKVMEHMQEHPVAEEEKAGVPTEDLQRIEEMHLIDALYGTTLLAYVQGEDFWVAFQIGDGEIVTCKGDDWRLPVPEDEDCRGHVTTSMCDFSAHDEFRFAYGGKDDVPDMAFVCSDGLVNCGESPDDLATFYDRLMRRYKSKEELLDALSEVLPALSLGGSRDDISLAGVILR